MCDKKCVQYRDCCSNSIHYKKEEQIKPSSYKCHSYPTSFEKGFLYVKAVCPESWKDAEISEKCDLALKRRLNAHNLDITTPVTSYSTNVTYANAYCALCNSDKNFEYWNVTVGCYDDGHYDSADFNGSEYVDAAENADLFNTTDFLLNTEQYVKTYFSLKSQLPDDCDLYFEVPKITQRDYCHEKEIIDSCPVTWHDQQSIELCRSVHSLVKGGWLIYRNKYCAYCNGVPSNLLTCSLKPEVVFHILSPQRPLTIIFNFRKVRNIPICQEKLTHLDPISLKVKKDFCPNEEMNDSTPENESNNWLVRWYTTVAISLSILFLILYLVVFTFVKEIRTFGGKNLASFCVALSLSYGSFLTGNFAEGTFCIAIAILTYYLFLVAFLCMLTMSYDIWRTFWNTTKKFRLLDNQAIRLVIYSLWNWLFPILPVLVALHVEFYSTSLEYAPRFGHNVCWFNNRFSLLVFFGLPVFAVLLANCAFFMHVLYMIKNNRCASVNKKTRVNFQIFARLALLSGLTWMTGLVAGYFQSGWMWFVFVFLNTSQGVFIFVAFVCKRRIIAELLGRVGILRKVTIRLKENGARKVNASAMTLTSVSSDKVSN